MILRSGGALAFLGVGIGVAAALGLTRLMEAMLFGVRPSDPLTYVAAASVLVLAAALASWLPAWRAAAVDPVVALRQD